MPLDQLPVTAAAAADDDSEVLAALVAAVTAFAAQEVAPRCPRPEQAPLAADFAAVAAAAERAGIVDGGADSCGLWSGLVRGETPAFPLSALVVLAAANPALAWQLHTRALAQAALALAGAAPVAGIALVADGGCGIGRSALGRLLAGRAPHDSDLALLADVYGGSDRVAVLAPATPQLLLLRIDAGGSTGAGSTALSLQCVDTRSVLRAQDPRPHGLDGCMAIIVAPPPAATPRLPLTTAQFASLFAAQQLAQVAIARGLLTPVAIRTREYAALRSQGARRIIMHDSVAALVADLELALAAVDALLRDAATRPANAADAVTVRREAMPLLARAANAALQVHGGSGYMRDTGVESALRAVNTLRLLGGTPPELGLVAAGLHAADSALPEDDEGAANRLPGHVPAGHPLSPLTAMQRLPLLRLVSAYTPRDPWEDETRQLPRALAALRRRVRAFALAECAPLAATTDLAQHDRHDCTPPLRSLLARAGRAGLLTDLLPAPLGSAPLRQYTHALALQQAIRAEELARVDGGLMLLLSAPNLGLAPLLLAGDLGILRRVVLPAFRATQAGNPQLFAFAITEPAAGSDAEDGHGALHQKVGVTARRSSGGWLLRGRKIFISGGDIARHIAVFAAPEGEGYAGWTCFLVDSRSKGFRVAHCELKMGMRASAAAELELDDCFVADADVVGGLRNGWGLARATLNLSRLPVAGMAVGFAQQAVDLATAFACRQRLAGRPLLHYRQTQATLADLQAETQAIRALVWQHARRWTPRQDSAAICKFHATDRAQVVIETALDLFGARGVLHGEQLERTFRDHRLTRIFEGTNQINRLAVIEDQQDSLLARIAAAGPAAIYGAIPGATP